MEDILGSVAGNKMGQLRQEIADLKKWVAQGNDPYGNPWHIADEHGWEMPYIHALRAEHDLIENG